MPRLPKFPNPAGAALKRQATNPPERADELADFVLQDQRGDDVRLGELWTEGPAVLVWLRHYG
jgi:prostamide/prostaglandin F2alpha synthase